MDDPVYLAGVGTAVPSHRFAQQTVAEFLCRVAEAQPGARAGFVRAVRKMSERSGIASRASVLPDYGAETPEGFRFFPSDWSLEPFPSTSARMARYEAEVVGLSAQAAHEALAASQVHPSEVTHLVFSTCTGFFAPGPDVLLMERLGLPTHARRVQVGFMGCYAGFNALRTALEISRADPAAVVLVVSAELCTLHLQRDLDLSTYVANLLFADGAAAAVIGRRPGRARLIDTHTRVFADTRDEMSWRIGDHGFVMHLSAEVPRHLEKAAAPFVDRLLASTRYTRSDVAAWPVHPGGPKVLEAVGSALGVPDSRMAESFDVLREHGNMSSATILFVLARSLERPGLQTALGFGPGLTMEGLLLEVGE